MNENVKLNFGRTLSSVDGDNYNHGDCFNYGSISGCDSDCPELNRGRCEVFKDAIEIVEKKEGCEIAMQLQSKLEDLKGDL